MALKQLIYMSDLVGRRESELASILESANRHNQRNGITGMLLYSEGNFLQVLEGEPDAVDATYQRICLDPRHRNIMLLQEEPVNQRDFAQWSMGYKRLSPEDVQKFPESAPYFKFGFNAPAFQAKPGDALLMLELFSKGSL